MQLKRKERLKNTFVALASRLYYEVVRFCHRMYLKIEKIDLFSV